MIKIHSLVVKTKRKYIIIFKSPFFLNNRACCSNHKVITVYQCHLLTIWKFNFLKIIRICCITGKALICFSHIINRRFIQFYKNYITSSFLSFKTNRIFCSTCRYVYKLIISLITCTISKYIFRIGQIRNNIIIGIKSQIYALFQ